MHDMRGHHNMPLATVALATVWDGVLVLDESFLQTNLSDVEQQSSDDVTWFTFTFTEHNVGFTAAATNGSMVNPNHNPNPNSNHNPHPNLSPNRHPNPNPNPNPNPGRRNVSNLYSKPLKKTQPWTDGSIDPLKL